MMTAMMLASEGLCSAMMITIISKKAIPSPVGTSTSNQIISKQLLFKRHDRRIDWHHLFPLPGRVDTHPLKMVEKKDTHTRKKIEGGCAVKGKIHRKKKTIHFREIAKGIEICGLLYYNIKYYYYVYIRFLRLLFAVEIHSFLLRIERGSS